MSNLEERKKAAMKELAEILDWANEERTKVFEKRLAQGGYLDRNKEDYAYIHQEQWRRIRELKAKYKDLPPDTKITFGDLK